MSTHIIPTYTRVTHVVDDMYSCIEHVEGRDDAEPVFTIRPLKACTRCNRSTVNWTTVSVKKADGGLLDLCSACLRARKETPLPLEETA